MKAKLPSQQPKRKHRRYALVKAEENGWKCELCGERLTKETVTADHIVPQSKNGRDNWGNVAPAHASCNSQKSDTPMEVFMQRKASRSRTKDGAFRIIGKIEVWNPVENEWVKIGAKCKKYITLKMFESGKYLFR